MYMYHPHKYLYNACITTAVNALSAPKMEVQYIHQSSSLVSTVHVHALDPLAIVDIHRDWDQHTVHMDRDQHIVNRDWDLLIIHKDWDQLIVHRDWDQHIVHRDWDQYIVHRDWDQHGTNSTSFTEIPIKIASTPCLPLKPRAPDLRDIETQRPRAVAARVPTKACKS